MTSTSTKVGHGLAKVLGIKLQDHSPTEPVTRGESVFSVSSADTYLEEEPTAADWIREYVPTKQDAVHYVSSLFPFLQWITRYNLQWFYGDLVAGITVGAVVVPQGMAYAKLANLEVQFGLYSSFMGVLIYWFFATSKDITIGPVAVMSTVVGNIVAKTNNTLPPEERGHVVASALAIICGGIVAFLGLFRVGWIVDLISLTAISAFMTGSAISIAVGQVPTMMGITGFSTRDAPYLVIINTLKGLPRTKLDAAMGLTALLLLYLIRSGCNFFAKRMPQRRKLFFFASTLRTVFVILLYTMISWLVNRNHKAKPSFAILGNVPRGFQNAAVPTINARIINSFVSELPAAVIVLLIEHISISKSFGRVNNYTINPSQELVAIGVTNLLAPFLGAYPATGSFSRTAIKSKAGVRTPFAGVITALVVLLAIYALPAVFFYIPNASLAAVIIHAVGDLITPPNTVYKFWRISPFEVFIFFAGVIVTVFSNIENGIYVTISVSAGLFLFRTFKAQGRFLGKVKVHSVIGDHLLGDEDPHKGGIDARVKSSGKDGFDEKVATRNVFLPIDHNDGSNPLIELENPYPGVFVYRFSEGYTYLNADHYLTYLTEQVFKRTRRTNPNSYPRLGDRPWNEPGPRRGRPVEDHSDRPTLKAIILDMSSVNNIDVTSVQLLIDVRNQLDRYASPDTVEWHFASINNRWTKRALASAGFGLPSTTYNANEIEGGFHRWKPVFSVAEIGGSDSAAAYEQWEHNRAEIARSRGVDDIEHYPGDRAEDLDRTLSRPREAMPSRKIAVVNGVNRPLFHADLTSAVQSAITNWENKASYTAKVEEMNRASPDGSTTD